MWESLAGSDPFGDERADWRIAKLASDVANLGMSMSGVRPTTSPPDFLLKFKEPETEKIDVATKIRNGFSRMMSAKTLGK